MLYVKNVETNVFSMVPDHYLDNPILGKNLILVEDEVQAAPNKETKTKEQPAPEDEPVSAHPKTTK